LRNQVQSGVVRLGLSHNRLFSAGSLVFTGGKFKTTERVYFIVRLLNQFFQKSTTNLFGLAKVLLGKNFLDLRQAVAKKPRKSFVIEGVPMPANLFYAEAKTQYKKVLSNAIGPKALLPLASFLKKSVQVVSYLHVFQKSVDRLTFLQKLLQELSHLKSFFRP
jgi:hypothetical protein